MKKGIFIITLLTITAACTQREDVSAWVCNCSESDSVRVARATLPDFDITEVVPKFCVDSVVAITSNWPNRVVRLDDNYDDCFNIYNATFNRIEQ